MVRDQKRSIKSKILRGITAACFLGILLNCIVAMVTSYWQVGFIKHVQCWNYFDYFSTLPLYLCTGGQLSRTLALCVARKSSLEQLVASGWSHQFRYMDANAHCHSCFLCVDSFLHFHCVNLDGRWGLCSKGTHARLYLLTRACLQIYALSVCTFFRQNSMSISCVRCSPLWCCRSCVVSLVGCAIWPPNGRFVAGFSWSFYMFALSGLSHLIAFFIYLQVGKSLKALTFALM